jgi:hypothetical protein
MNTTSSISSKTQAAFIRKEFCGDLLQDNIPGIKEVAIETLRIAGITTTFQLIAKFLSLKGIGVSPREHCKLFFAWLKSIGINSNRKNILMAIADKCSVLFSGLSGEVPVEAPAVEAEVRTVKAEVRGTKEEKKEKHK